MDLQAIAAASADPIEALEMEKKSIDAQIADLVKQDRCDAEVFLRLSKESQAIEERIDNLLKEKKEQEEKDRRREDYHETLRQSKGGKPPDHQAYYERRASRYWVPDPTHRGSWTCLNETGMKRRLERKGLDSSKRKRGSKLNQALDDIALHYHVDFADELAGYEPGPHHQGTRQILVTAGPEKKIQPLPGKFPVLQQLLDNMLREERQYFDGWLKVAVEALRNGERRLSQVMIFVGPKNAGKSLVQNYIVTPLLGNRMAKPYRYFSGRTEFNADLMRAEHLMIEDDVANTDIKSRRHFGTNLKQVAANEGVSCHGKYKEAIMLYPRWRCTLSVNEEREHLMILPPLEDGLEDKLMILKVTRAPMPMPTVTNEDRHAFRKAIEDELPHYLDYLMKMEIRADLRDSRYGIRTFQNPEILGWINQLSPEFALLELIDTHLSFNGKPWYGTARQLQTELESVSPSIGRLLSWSGACGTYLTRLADKPLGRIKRTELSDNTYYTIMPPERSERSESGKWVLSHQ
jgi:hypothetical protein